MDRLGTYDGHSAGNDNDNFPTFRSDVNHSPAFDGQALQDEDEAELLRDDEERENELKELLTTAFNDEDGDLLEDDCSSESSLSSHDSSRHSAVGQQQQQQREPTNWLRRHEGRGHQAGLQSVSTPVAAHTLPPLLTPCYDTVSADAHQLAAKRYSSSVPGDASPELQQPHEKQQQQSSSPPQQQRQQSSQQQQLVDSRPQTAASGRSGDASGRSSGDASRRSGSVAASGGSGHCRSGSRSSSSSNSSGAATPSQRDGDSGPDIRCRSNRSMDHRQVGWHDQTQPRHPAALTGAADLASSSGSVAGLQSSGGASSMSASFSLYHAEQLGESEGTLPPAGTLAGCNAGRDDVAGSTAAVATRAASRRLVPAVTATIAGVAASDGGATDFDPRRKSWSTRPGSPKLHSPLPPRDQGDGALQGDYFHQGVGMHSDGRQLEILLHARGRQLQDLTERHELLQLDSAKEIRLLKHQLALLEGENRGLDGSLKEARSLLVTAAEERQRLHAEAEQLRAATRRLTAERDKAFEEQHSAEATAEALSQQLLTLGGSDGFSRARQQHDAVIAALTERHDAIVAEKQRTIADLTTKILAQKEECDSVRAELAAATLAAQTKQAENAEIVNKLAKSLEECQRQNNELLLTGTTQELMKLKVELQQASASRLLTEQLCTSLQNELEQLKEQVNMYEAACSLGVISVAGSSAAAGSAGDSGTPLITGAVGPEPSTVSTNNDSSTLLLPVVPLDDTQPGTVGSRTLDWRTPAISKIARPFELTAPRSPSPIESGSDGSSLLKSELQRALLSTKTKREQISALQATVRQLQSEVHAATSANAALKQRLADAEALVRDREAELQLYKTAAEQGESIADVRSRKEIESLRKELLTVKDELEETTRRLHEVAASEECLNDINDELRRQMAQLVKDFDDDKRASLQKCQETLMKHHEDVKRTYIDEHRTQMEREFAERETHLMSVTQQLRQELADRERELTSAREHYVQLSEEKRRDAELAANQLAELRRSCEAEKESALRAQLETQQLAVAGAVLVSQQQCAEQRCDDQVKAEIAAAKAVTKEWQQRLACVRAELEERERDAIAAWQRKLDEAEDRQRLAASDHREAIDRLTSECDRHAAKCSELQKELELRRSDCATTTAGCASPPSTASESSTARPSFSAAAAAATERSSSSSTNLSSSLPAKQQPAAAAADGSSMRVVPTGRPLSASCGPPFATTTADPTSGASRGLSSKPALAAVAGDSHLASILALHAAAMARLRAEHEAEKARLLRLHDAALVEQRAASEKRSLAAAAEAHQVCQQQFAEQLGIQERSLRADYEQRVAELRRDLDDMRSLAQRLEETLESSRRRHAESVAELTARHERSLAEAKEHHERSLDEVRRRHEENLRLTLAEANRLRAAEVERAGVECRDFNAELQRACTVLERQQASQEQQRAALEAALHEQNQLQEALRTTVDDMRSAREQLDAADTERRKLHEALGAAAAECDRLRTALSDVERRLTDAEAALRSSRSELEHQRALTTSAATAEREARRDLLACRSESERQRATAEVSANERRSLERALRASRDEVQCSQDALREAERLREQMKEALNCSEELRRQAEEALVAATAAEQQRMIQWDEQKRQQQQQAEAAAAAELRRLDAELLAASDGWRQAERALAELRAEWKRSIDEITAAHERRLAECAERHSSALSSELSLARNEADRERKAMADTLQRLTAEMKQDRDLLVEEHSRQIADTLKLADERAKEELAVLDRRLHEEARDRLDAAERRIRDALEERDRSVSSLDSLWCATTDLLNCLRKEAPSNLASAMPASSDLDSTHSQLPLNVEAQCAALRQASSWLMAVLRNRRDANAVAKLVGSEPEPQQLLQAATGDRDEHTHYPGRPINVTTRSLPADAASSSLITGTSYPPPRTQQLPIDDVSVGPSLAAAATLSAEEPKTNSYAELIISVQEDVSNYVAETNRKAAGVIHAEVSAARLSAERVRKFCIKSLKKMISGHRENPQLVSELQQLRSVLRRNDWKKPPTAEKDSADCPLDNKNNYQRSSCCRDCRDLSTTVEAPITAGDVVSSGIGSLQHDDVRLPSSKLATSGQGVASLPSYLPIWVSSTGTSKQDSVCSGTAGQGSQCGGGCCCCSSRQSQLVTNRPLLCSTQQPFSAAREPIVTLDKLQHAIITKESHEVTNKSLRRTELAAAADNYGKMAQDGRTNGRDDSSHLVVGITGDVKQPSEQALQGKARKTTVSAMEADPTSIGRLAMRTLAAEGQTSYTVCSLTQCNSPVA